MLTPFSQLSDSQLYEIYIRFFNGISTYSILSSIHGYSFTELSQETKSNPDYKQELVLIDDEVIGCIRLDQKNWIDRSLRVILGIQVQDKLQQFANEVQSLLNSLIQYEGINRFYIYCQPHEQAIKDVCSILQFQQEVVLGQHLYINGHYQNLEIWGTKR